MYLNILFIVRYLIIYNSTLSTRYDYLLPFIYKQMFISNIIYKLSAIIYKLGIIYKATTAPTNKDQQRRSTNINTGSIEPLYTTFDHTLSTQQQAYAPLSCSYEPYFSIYFLYFPHSYSYLSIEVLCFAGPPSCQGYLSKPTREVQDRTQPRPSQRVTVPDFGKNKFK